MRVEEKIPCWPEQYILSNHTERIASNPTENTRGGHPSLVPVCPKQAYYKKASGKTQYKSFPPACDGPGNDQTLGTAVPVTNHQPPQPPALQLTCRATFQNAKRLSRNMRCSGVTLTFTNPIAMIVWLF